MIENDCEDQGFTRIKDGCFRCLTIVRGKPVRRQFVKRKSPSNSSLPNGGPLYWFCEGCNGYYGEVQR